MLMSGSGIGIDTNLIVERLYLTRFLLLSSHVSRWHRQSDHRGEGGARELAVLAPGTMKIT